MLKKLKRAAYRACAEAMIGILSMLVMAFVIIGMIFAYEFFANLCTTLPITGEAVCSVK